jgi:hypothetical protein
MVSFQDYLNHIPEALKVEYQEQVCPYFRGHLEQQDGAPGLTAALRNRFGIEETTKANNGLRVWELCGLFYINTQRWNEARSIFDDFYDYLLQYQRESKVRQHKGLPLCWLSDCYAALNCPVLALRYLMLTTCEDAIRDEGKIPPERSGAYFRWITRFGMTDHELKRYSAKIWELYQGHEQEAYFPEWIVQKLDHHWMTAFPSNTEIVRYVINVHYAHQLYKRLGEGDGKTLEQLAHYLLSAIPGCRAYSRQPTYSTDYDVICAFEGSNLDFRSDLGRYFICECKDWDKTAGFSTFAKFCRVLDAAKCQFGIIFSKNGISGEDKNINAEREQLKVFQDRGMVIVVFSESDLCEVISGVNFVTLLREKYENVRLDLKRKS